MLYELYWHLHSDWSVLNIFRYETVRGSLAFVVSFLVAILFGGRIIEMLRSRRIGEEIKSDSAEVAELHASKAGTPTMGGVIILAALTTGVAVCGRFDSFFLLTALATTLALGVVGAIDGLLNSVTAEQWFSLQQTMSKAQYAKLREAHGSDHDDQASQCILDLQRLLFQNIPRAKKIRGVFTSDQFDALEKLGALAEKHLEDAGK